MINDIFSSLKDNWQSIATECNAIDRNNIMDIDVTSLSREDVAHALVKSQKPQWIRGWDGHNGWLNYGIAINYNYPLGDAGLPYTTSLLKKISGIKFANLSLFKAGTFLPMHAHPEMLAEGLLTFHLGLDVPLGCYLSVDGEFEREENGKAIIFDGSKSHYAFNDSDKDRLILYCEFSSQNIHALN